MLPQLASTLLVSFTSLLGSKNSGAPKDPAAPKRPPGAFFIFMEDFRKSFKENFPENKSVSMVGKAGGDKWKSMSHADKVPYFEKAQSRKAEYAKALEAYQKRVIVDMIIEKPAESEKSSSEVHDNAEQEASS
ncbi:HMG1/2-like protein [Carica papaya]|uniref:HMG1/2-like protein n=1 Tax=Carica papaya TaxID=3649 RepID=UPI000B8CB997|nr:HMG1/2-like protein [Carica papaya]